MQKALLCLSILISYAAYSQGWSDPTIHVPSLAEQYQQALQYKVDRLVQDIRTDDYFAGKSVTIQGLGGQQIVVDRSKEAAKVPIGQKPPSMAILGDILNGLSAESRGHVKLDIDREYFLPSQGGGVKHEHWQIDLSGAAQVSVGGDDEKLPVQQPPTDQ